MTEKVIMAGFGGQGIMSIGKMLAYAGMIEGKEVTWLPSYGPEMRGGTANCGVIVSDKFIGSPVITEASSALVLNLPSLLKFEESVITGGNIIINSSLIDKKVQRDAIKAYYVSANEIATELGNSKSANMVMLGAYIELSKIVSIDAILKAFLKVFGKERTNLLPLNERALKKGSEAVGTKA